MELLNHFYQFVDILVPIYLLVLGIAVVFLLCYTLGGEDNG